MQQSGQLRETNYVSFHKGIHFSELKYKLLKKVTLYYIQKQKYYDVL
jgi:hypothetical protein